MRRGRAWLWLLAAPCLVAGACLLQACAGEAPQVQKTALSAGVVARVDGEPIYADTVAAIARAQRISADEALKKATFDALLAREARSRGIDRRAHTEISARLAQQLIDELAREARALGEPTDDELGPFVESQWLELNRPDGVVVAHIVVITPKIAETDAATDEAALAIARKVRAAVAVVQADVRKAKEPDFNVTAGPFKPDPIVPLFQDLGTAVEHEGFELVVNAIPPFGADGWVQKRGQPEMMDPRFVKAAFALEARGDLSEPVRSDSGWHVILKLGKTTGYQAPRAQLLERFRDIVIEERARNALAAIVARGRKEQDASVERNTDELTLQVKVGR